MQGILSNKLFYFIIILLVILVLVYIYTHYIDKELFTNPLVNTFFGKTFNTPTSGYYYIKVNNTNNYLSFTSNISSVQEYLTVFSQNITGTLNLTTDINNNNSIFYIDEYGQILNYDKTSYLVSYSNNIEKNSSIDPESGKIAFFLPVTINPLTSTNLSKNLQANQFLNDVLSNPFIYDINNNSITSKNLSNNLIGNLDLPDMDTGLYSNALFFIINDFESYFNNLFSLSNAPNPNTITTTTQNPNTITTTTSTTSTTPTTTLIQNNPKPTIIGEGGVHSSPFPPTPSYYYIKINQNGKYLKFNNTIVENRSNYSIGSLDITDTNISIDNIFYIDNNGVIFNSDLSGFMSSTTQFVSTENNYSYQDYRNKVVFLRSDVNPFTSSIINNPALYDTNTNNIVTSVYNSNMIVYINGYIYQNDNNYNNLYTLINAPNPNLITKTTVPTTTVTTTIPTTIATTTVPTTTVPTTTIATTKVLTTTVPTTTIPTTTLPRIINTKKAQPPLITVASSQPTQAPVKTNYSVIDYANDLETENNITSIPECSTMYDDNILVKNIGYENCTSAYSDYIHKNLDPTENYDYNKSLEEMCPITTRSPKYINCMKALYGKFNQANTMLGVIGNDVSDIINQRLTDRQNIINDLNTNLVNNITKDIPITPTKYANTLNYNLLDNIKYSEDRNIPFKTEQKKTVENFENPTITSAINLAIDFLGSYKLLKGQFIILSDIKLNLSINELIVVKDNEVLAVLGVKKILGAKDYPDTIEIVLNSLDIKTDINTWLPIQNIFKTLGIETPCVLYLTLDKYITTENNEYKMYRLFNDSHDTIMYLEKIENN